MFSLTKQVFSEIITGYYWWFMLTNIMSVHAQPSLTLCNPMDCSWPGSFCPWFFQARILKWVAISSFRGSFQPKDWTLISHVYCVTGTFFTAEPLGFSHQYIECQCKRQFISAFFLAFTKIESSTLKALRVEDSNLNMQLKLLE